MCVCVSWGGGGGVDKGALIMNITTQMQGQKVSVNTHMMHELHFVKIYKDRPAMDPP